MSAWEETGVMVVGRKFRCTKCKKAQHMANANYVGDVCPDCKPRKGRK
jgi:Zn finger protein HypA/HybF involved in hydrogenase expression